MQNECFIPLNLPQLHVREFFFNFDDFKGKFVQMSLLIMSTWHYPNMDSYKYSQTAFFDIAIFSFINLVERYYGPPHSKLSLYARV